MYYLLNSAYAWMAQAQDAYGWMMMGGGDIAMRDMGHGGMGTWDEGQLAASHGRTRARRTPSAAIVRGVPRPYSERALEVGENRNEAAPGCR